MRRVNVMVSNEAKEKLKSYQRFHRINTQDEALDKLIMEVEIQSL
jgi:hypothetical protein